MVSDGENIIADIGSDHAYLAIYLAKSAKVKKIFATELNDGPYEITKTNIRNFGVAHIVEAIKADGLKWIEDKKISISSVIIAGMGTTTILKILENDSKFIDCFILSPNTDAFKIRKWVKNKKYFIEDEKLILDNEIIYELIKVNKYAGKKIKNYKDLFFGPILRKTSKDNRLFTQKWILEEEKYTKLLTTIPNDNLNFKKYTKLKKIIGKYINKELKYGKAK